MRGEAREIIVESVAHSACGGIKKTNGCNNATQKVCNIQSVYHNRVNKKMNKGLSEAIMAARNEHDRI